MLYQFKVASEVRIKGGEYGCSRKLSKFAQIFCFRVKVHIKQFLNYSHLSSSQLPTYMFLFKVLVIHFPIPFM